MNKKQTCLFLLLGALLTSCANTFAPEIDQTETPIDSSVTANQESPSSEASDVPIEEIEYGHFSPDILTRVILAEMAGQRGQDQQALETYLALARDTSDLGIIKRTSRIAAFLRDGETVTEMAELWLSQEPDSVEAYQALALQMLSIGRYGDAIDHLATLVELGETVDFRVISNRTEIDPDAGLFRESLITDLDELSFQFPTNQSIRLALAHLYQQNQQTRKAYELVSQLSEELNGPAEVIMLEVELLESLNENELAMTRLEYGVDAHPSHIEMRFKYGRKLVENLDFENAAEQFSIITQQDPQDLDMLYSLALINIEMNRLREAQSHFESLVVHGHRIDDTHYYLGFILNQHNEIDQAIEHYMQVNRGSNFLQAQRDLTELLVQADRYPEAQQRLQRLRYTSPEYNQPLLSLEAGILIDEGHEDDASALLNSSLQVYPDNVQLLYLRSVISTNQNNLTLMEQDLRRMIELNPNSPVAYNSLGYILADRTDRADEAYALILRAIELAPDDPAIIDSLGWIQYRLGMLEEAKLSLENAFALFPDHEVAAHLGEVLWALGDRRAANRIWQDALKLQPDSSFIRETIQRLNPESGS